MWKMEEERDGKLLNHLLHVLNTPASSSSSTSSSKVDNPLYQNCKLVQRLLKESEKELCKSTGKMATGIKTKEKHLESDCDDSAFVHFDRVLASSVQNQCLLRMQWDCLLQRLLLSEQGPNTSNFLLSTANVAGMLIICRKLKVNFVVRFRSLELYNRFLNRFARKYENFFRESTPKAIQEFKRRFESQVFLRMSTCVLIASKLHADTQTHALTTDRVKVFLDAEGFEFTRTNVVRSEMRIMEILNFTCLFVTPLDLVEQLLSILGLKLEYLKQAHHFSVLLLEYSYCDLAALRDKYRTAITKSKRFTVSNGKISVLLLSAAIAAAALFLVSADMKTNYHKVVAKTANVQEEDVHLLAVLLIESLRNE